MKVSIFTDEISTDPTRAIELAAQWGLKHVEVRDLPGGRFPRPQDDELKRFLAGVRDAGLSVSGVSPGFFKCPIEDPAVPLKMREQLPRACEWALQYGVDQLTCFGFARDDSDGVPTEVIDGLGQMADIVIEHGCRLVLENEAICWGATGLEAAAMIRKIGSERIQLCWDPGNSAHAGSAHSFPDEYERIKDLIVHVHMKNYDPAGSSWQLLETGVVDWTGQLAALRADGYEGFVVIETHLSISLDEFKRIDHDLDALEANSYRNLQFVRSRQSQ